MHGYEDPFAHRVRSTAPSSTEEVTHRSGRQLDADRTIDEPRDTDPPSVDDDHGAGTLDAFARDLTLGRREALVSYEPSHRLRRVGESRR